MLPTPIRYQAISRATKLNNSLLEFTIGSVTEGTKALGQVLVRVGPPEEDQQSVLEENLKHNAQTGFFSIYFKTISTRMYCI
jgi:hypothetical protein